MSLYNLLGVPHTATPKDIKKQFYKLSLLYHPDLAETKAEAEWRKAKFIEISKAYAILQDPRQRQQYDATQAQHPQLRPFVNRSTWNGEAPSPSFMGEPIERRDCGPSPFSMAQGSRFSWSRLSRQPTSRKQSQQASEEIKAMREEDLKMAKRRLLVFGVGFIAYLFLFLR
jgi:DnaJ-class molecular chaperone